MKNSLNYLLLIISLPLFIGCSSNESPSNTTKADERPFWEKSNANERVTGLLKKAQDALKEYQLKPDFLSDTADVQKFLDNHKAYAGKVQIDTLSLEQKAYVGTVYVSDEVELAATQDSWGIVFKSSGPNKIFIFKKNGWAVYALSGRSSDIGIWKNDIYYLDMNGQVSESETKSKNIRMRGTKYLKQHVGILRSRAKRTDKK